VTKNEKKHEGKSDEELKKSKSELGEKLKREKRRKD
jgi:hypothetical protein